MAKKETVAIFQLSGFKYEPWSPLDLVHTPTPPEPLGKPYFTSLHNAIQTSVYLMELHKN